MSIEWPSGSEEKTSKEKQWELSRTGWDLDRERREKEIFELKEPMCKILRSLSEDIDNGKIQFLVGDDTSGRVPTLILKKCIARLYDKQQLPSPETYFINGPGGGLRLNDEQFEQRVNLVTQHLNKCMENRDVQRKILLITEAINSGDSIRPTLEACKRLEMLIEIVAVGVDRDEKDIEKDLDVKIHFGMYGTPLIYNKPAYAGVYKKKPSGLERYGDKPAPLIAESYKQTVQKKDQLEKQQWLNEIRREVDVLVDEVVEFYEKSK